MITSSINIIVIIRKSTTTNPKHVPNHLFIRLFIIFGFILKDTILAGNSLGFSMKA